MRRCRIIEIDLAPPTNPARQQFFLAWRASLKDRHGHPSWRVKGWRHYWIVSNFLWAYLVWQVLKPLLCWLFPVLLLLGLGALLGHLLWR